MHNHQRIWARTIERGCQKMLDTRKWRPASTGLRRFPDLSVVLVHEALRNALADLLQAQQLESGPCFRAIFAVRAVADSPFRPANAQITDEAWCL